MCVMYQMNPYRGQENHLHTHFLDIMFILKLTELRPLTTEKYMIKQMVLFGFRKWINIRRNNTNPSSSWIAIKNLNRCIFTSFFKCFQVLRINPGQLSQEALWKYSCSLKFLSIIQSVSQLNVSRNHWKQIQCITITIICQTYPNTEALLGLPYTTGRLAFLHCLSNKTLCMARQSCVDFYIFNIYGQIILYSLDQIYTWPIYIMLTQINGNIE